MPRAALTSAPIREMTTDSQRTIARTWSPRHADRPQQAQLTGPLEHRQHQGVDDAQQGDDDREQCNITVTKVSNWSMKPLASFSKPLRSSTFASGWSARPP